jgi:hypothetical protein
MMILLHVIQLIDAECVVAQLADHFCNAVGVLQQSAPPGQFAGFERTASKPPGISNDGWHGLHFCSFVI